MQEMLADDPENIHNRSAPVARGLRHTTRRLDPPVWARALTCVDTAGLAARPRLREV
jgi:hypothetical protein